MRTLMMVCMVPVVLLFGGCSKSKPTGPDNNNHAPAGMVSISGGTFQMGSTNGYSDEQPVDTVTVSAFYMDTTEVTQADYDSLMHVNPSSINGDLLRPVETVTWFDAVLYCNARSIRDGLTPCYDTTTWNCTFTNNGYRLPTEAEWEYACRAGSTTDFYWGKNSPPITTADTAAIDNNAVWRHNSNSSTARVGTKLPNAWGLYDMSGNVWEWCNDWYDTCYTSGSQTDPTGPSTGTSRVLRGGSWDDLYGYFRSAYRYRYGYPYNWSDSFGFRVVCGGKKE